MALVRSRRRLNHLYQGSQWIFSLVLVHRICFSQAKHVYTDSFPTFDEYDYKILDIHSALGSPLGGYSRATRSRLAVLPLHLPLEKDQSGEDDPTTTYMEVTDAEGRTFSCRVYHEDELDPDSLDDSMFDAPKLSRRQVSLDATTAKAPMVAAAAAAANTATLEVDVLVPERALDLAPETTLALGSSEKTDPPVSHNTGLATATTGFEVKSAMAAVADHISNLVLSERQLVELEGVCGQLHKGWWSYEWCHRASVRQFHLVFEQQKKNQLQIESITTLGKFHSRTITTDLDQEPPNVLTDSAVTEIARIVDHYTGGDVCDETAEPRQTFVHLQCCGPVTMTKTHAGGGLLHKDGHRIQSNAAAVVQIVENPTCHYNVTVCTPLLCHDPSSQEDKGVLQEVGAEVAAFIGALENAADAVAVAVSAAAVDGESSSSSIEGMSVREILRRNLRRYCIRSDSSEWWTYEYCHGRHVRQYHETIGTKKTESGLVATASIVEAEHILGLYDAAAAETYPDEDWRFVVNTTSSKIGAGNGAYFELEYTGGNVCDHSDVTGAAIIAGNAGVGGVERACSVRYYCGITFSISVNEDSTCHYIVKVFVPDLCRHPLFVAPVVRKQVFKCLPVD
jgi:hypothetical protein